MTDEPIADVAVTVPITSSEVVYTGAVWNVRRDDFSYNGVDLVREYVEHTGAVAIYAEDADGRVLVIQQYRHPVGLRDWELPAGLRDIAGEDPLTAAQRELAEEADLAADTWSELVRINTTPGGSSEQIIVYRASGLHATETFEREAEEADIVVRWVPRAQIVDGVLAGRLTNGILATAVLAAEAAAARG